MTGPAKSKIPIKAKVYIHLKDKKTGSKIIHIDVESNELNKLRDCLERFDALIENSDANLSLRDI